MELEPVSVPVIVAEPTPVFNVAPPGSVPVVFAKLVASVQVNVKLIVPPPATDPKDPEPVTQAGPGETVKIAEADVTVPPSGLMTLIK